MYVNFQLNYLNIISGTGAGGNYLLTSLGPRKLCEGLKITCTRGETGHSEGLILIINKIKLRFASL